MNLIDFVNFLSFKIELIYISMKWLEIWSIELQRVKWIKLMTLINIWMFLILSLSVHHLLLLLLLFILFLSFLLSVNDPLTESDQYATAPSHVFFFYLFFFVLLLLSRHFHHLLLLLLIRFSAFDDYFPAVRI